jgi:Spy/CpxP family protein refolding chaperone
MKKNLVGMFVAVIAILLVNSGLYAQGMGNGKGFHRGPMGQKVIKKLIKGIILSDAQAGKITQITSTFKEQMQQANKTAIDARKDFKKKSMDLTVDESTLKALAEKLSENMLQAVTLRRKMINELKSILTDEQKVIFEKNIIDFKENVDKCMKGNKKGKCRANAKGGKGKGNGKGKGKGGKGRRSM